MLAATKRLLPVLVAVLVLAGCNRKSRTELPPKDDNDTQEVKPGGIVDALKEQKDAIEAAGKKVELPDNADDLMSFLARKETEQLREADPNQQFLLQQLRANASGKLLKLPLNKEQRFEAVRIRLDSLLRLIAMGLPDAQVEFHKFVSSLKDDQQPRIAQAVAVAGLVNEFSRRISRQEKDMSQVIESARQIAEKYPDSFEVCKEIGMVGERLLKMGDRESWQQLGQVLVNIYSTSNNETAGNMAGNLRSRIQVAATNLERIVNDIQKGFPGAFEQYRTVVGEILADAQINARAVGPILSSLRWLENNKLIDEALEANRIVVTASLDMKSPALRDQLRQNCKLRDTRLSLAGKPFSIAALSARGNWLDWTKFSRDHVVMVIFWTPSEPGSVEAVRKLAKIHERHKDQGLRLLAVNLSSNADAASLFGDELPEWEIVSGNPTVMEGPSEFYGMFGVETAPQLILVNRFGIAVSVNPRADDIEQAIDELLNGNPGD